MGALMAVGQALRHLRRHDEPAPDIFADVVYRDQAGLARTFLGRTPDPAKIAPGSRVTAGDVGEWFRAVVVDLVPGQDGRTAVILAPSDDDGGRIDLEADLNSEDDEGRGWARASAALDPDALRPGAVLRAGSAHFWSWVRIDSIDPDGRVHFHQLGREEP
jgi:hypothetical protein